MDGIDPQEPIYNVYVDGVLVATLFEPRIDDMFWCSYRVEPTNEYGDLAIHDETTWERVNFTVTDMCGAVPSRKTFSGGYHGFCDRKSNRLSFRSLWPPGESRLDSVVLWLKDRIRAIIGI